MNEQNELVSAALVAVQGELQAASFDSQNPFLRNRYASLGAIIEASRPILAKHGLAVLQLPKCDGKSVILYTELRHQSGQHIECGQIELPLGEEKGKSLAQVAGSLITYARRYAWATVLGMYAEEDTDAPAPAPKKAPGRAVESPPPSSQPPPVKMPPRASQGPSAAPEKAVSAKFRLKALNNLQGAPGQPNRALVQHFLMSKGWINGEQSPEQDWQIGVPQNKEQMAALTEEVQVFEIQLRQPEVVEP